MADNMDLPAAQPQPNFQLMAECHQTLSTQLQRCENLPTIVGAQDILSAINQLQVQINQKFDRMEARLSALYAHLDIRTPAHARLVAQTCS